MEELVLVAINKRNRLLFIQLSSESSSPKSILEKCSENLRDLFMSYFFVLSMFLLLLLAMTDFFILSASIWYSLDSKLTSNSLDPPPVGCLYLAAKDALYL